MAGKSPYKMTTNPWKWSSIIPIYTFLLHPQCMLLRIQNYDYIIQYKPGKEMVLAGKLWRFPSCKENIPIALHQHMDHIHFSDWWLNSLEKQYKDTQFTTPIQTHSQWLAILPSEGALNSPSLWGTRDELSVENGILMKGARVSIPLDLYDRTLAELHENNNNIEKNVTNSVIKCLLARHQCRHHWLHKEMHQVHPSKKSHRLFNHC